RPSRLEPGLGLGATPGARTGDQVYLPAAVPVDGDHDRDPVLGPQTTRRAALEKHCSTDGHGPVHQPPGAVGLLWISEDRNSAGRVRISISRLADRAKTVRFCELGA